MRTNQLVKLTNKLAKRVLPTNIQPSIAYYVRWLKAPLYFGNSFDCPICEGHFRTFLPNGSPLRLNSLCPRCFSKERHRLLWVYLQERTEIFSTRSSLLHISPMGVMQRKFRKIATLEYISIDLYSPRAMLKMDVTNLKFHEKKFDSILCFHVLEHVPDDLKAMSELYRVLKPGGWAIIQVPIEREVTFEDPSVITDVDRLRVYGQTDHVRSYGFDYKQRLENAGFTVTLDNFYQEMSLNKIEKYGLINNLESEYIYLCKKPVLNKTSEEAKK